MGNRYTVVRKRPPCDLCQAEGVTRPAYADARLEGPHGEGGGRSWAFVCKPHFVQYRCSLGLGAGQQLIERHR